MKYSPYSFSKLNLHNQCNRRFKYRYIDKIKETQVDKTALLKGGAIHSILEMYPNESTHKLAPKYQNIADDFIMSNLGKKYLGSQSTREYNFGLTSDLEPCSYSDKSALFRGSIDYIANIDGILNLIDWKSGKLKDIKWQDFNQLMFYAIYFFKKYSKVDEIKISYVYVEHNEENSIILNRKYLEKYIGDLSLLINDTEQDTDFIKNESKLCEWCPYKRTCEKN